MHQSRRPWTKNEDQAVIQIVDQVGLKNWPLVSTLMKQKYNVVGRSGKQCRQRWHNQLNPQVNKKPWTEQEEKLLFEAHKTHRNRWIDISKLFQGRTDNSIKNHFYSTIRRSLRRICKLLGNKNSTSQLRNIKPSILSKIFEYSELKGDQVTKENEQIVNESKSIYWRQKKVITEELLNFARSKPTRVNENVEDGKRRNLQSLIDKLNEFSKNYKSQKDSYHVNPGQKPLSMKLPKVIIVKHQPLEHNHEPSSQMSPKTVEQNLCTPTKKPKNYLYDWQQFEKRCLYVKQVFQNQTQSKSPQASCSKDQEGSSMSNEFSLQEKSSDLDKFSDKLETYTTPRNAVRNKGFQLYKDTAGAMGRADEYDGIVEKLKFQIGER